MKTVLQDWIAYGEALLRFESGLIEHFRLIPSLNANWTALVSGALLLMCTGDFPRCPRNLRDRKAKAEDLATQIRNATYHIRRQWYRKSQTPDFMKKSQRPLHIKLEDFGIDHLGDARLPDCADLFSKVTHI